MLSEGHHQAQCLLDFINASPSPWHAGEQIARQLDDAGFVRLDERAVWRFSPGMKAYVQRGCSSVIAFAAGQAPVAEAGFRIVGAHTDSPGLRIKPRGAFGRSGWIQLGVEIYGGPILATWTDRDLSLAGRVYIRSTPLAPVEMRLLRFPNPLLRLPNLAIHLNRAVNEDGLKLHKQNELPLLLMLEQGLPAGDQWLDLLAHAAGVQPSQVVSWELQVFDAQPAAFWGPESEFIAGGRLDNLASCHAGLSAMLGVDACSRATRVMAFFDHEEIGSETAQGADGAFLGDVLERIVLASGPAEQDYKRALAGSRMISVDMAHGYHPNYPGAYEPEHKVQINGGPVIKSHACGQYATDASTEADMIALFEQAGTPWQRYVHRTDLACGSTIGPMTAARLGIPTVDIGNPMWAMHSARESAGVHDHAAMIAVLSAFLAG